MTGDEMICNMKEIRVFSDKPTVGLLKFAESTGLVIYAKVNRDGNTRYEKGYTSNPRCARSSKRSPLRSDSVPDLPRLIII